MAEMLSPHVHMRCRECTTDAMPAHSRMVLTWKASTRLAWHALGHAPARQAHLRHPRATPPRDATTRCHYAGTWANGGAFARLGGHTGAGRTCVADATMYVHVSGAVLNVQGVHANTTCCEHPRHLAFVPVVHCSDVQFSLV